jgi:hypothetical protein
MGGQVRSGVTTGSTRTAAGCKRTHSHRFSQYRWHALVQLSMTYSRGAAQFTCFTSKKVQILTLQDNAFSQLYENTRSLSHANEAQAALCDETEEWADNVLQFLAERQSRMGRFRFF